MSFKADIPTLSANEVYTLTFEYEGTETIQLIVGDLTLETTDRRVVFTTTSPVNYIESNVNLTNLNMYEGYYESDDFGGEYTQESYIEGKSLINYKRRVDYGTLVNNADIQETFTDDGYINYKQLGTGATGGGFRGNRFVGGIDQSKDYTIVLRVRKNTFPTDVFVPFALSHAQNGVKFDRTVKGSQRGISYDIYGGQMGVWKAVIKGSGYNASLSSRYWGNMASFFVDENSEVTDLTQRTDIIGCEIEYAIEVLQGDYFDIDTGIDEHFEGIGCVKSPKIVSHKAKNLVPTFKIISGYGSNAKIEVFDDNKHIEFANTSNDARLQFQFDVTSIGLTSGDLLGIEFDAMTKGVGTVANKTSAHLMFFNIKNIDDKTNISYFETGHYKNVVEIIDNSIQIHFRQNIKGANGNEYFIVKNFSVFKINSVDDMKDDYEECIITTPDDLELYELNGIFDKLDLTSGIVTKYIGNNNGSLYLLDVPTTEQLSLNPLKSYRNGSITTSSQQLTPTLKTTLPVSNKFTTTNLTSGSTYNVYFDGTATKLDAGGTIITDPVSPCEVECGGTALTIEGADIQNVRVLETTVKNEVGSVNGTTDVELKKIKTYKYENILDDITYSTTVSNGAVININYDDFCIEFMGNHGWAAEFADTGLKYPSGCNLVHVEFDIDMDKPNLRMAINFNEGIRNNYSQHRHVTLNNDTATIAQGTCDNIYTSIITKGHFSRLMYANGDRPIIINLYTGRYITGNLATGNSAEGSIDGYETIGTNYGRITNLRMRIIENFSSNYTTVTSVLRDSSYNIIWQDMDMTMPTTTSKLEQPIKLRSLGTTYDSYNPITGELTKRIGVSETDGSYSVLSSPVISKVEINNIPRLYKDGIIKIYSDSNIYPMIILEIPTTNKYDTSTWETGVYTQRNIVEMYFNDSTTPMIPTETLTLTENHLSGHMIIVGENPMLIKGNYAGRDIPYFTGMRSVEAIEVETTPSPDQPLFGKGGRK